MMACFTFMSLGQVQTTDFSFNFTSLGFTYEGEATDGAPSGTFLHTWYFFTLSLFTAVILLIDIFLYGNLPLQKRVCLIGVLFIIASAACGGVLGYCAVEGGQIGWSSVALAPVLALCATLLAYNRMQSDHKKLKAVDRIR
jgi:hypothetical protein